MPQVSAPRVFSQPSDDPTTGTFVSSPPVRYALPMGTAVSPMRGPGLRTGRSSGAKWAVTLALVAFLLERTSTARAGPSRAENISRFAQRWLGTQYRWGGTTRGGIDCSAYLREMYRDLFQVELPRTTRQQIAVGVGIAVDPRDLGRTLQPGDLLFYVDPNGTPNHVVVYMGGDRITHSVLGRGVVIDPIRRVYGRRIAARRLLVPQSGRTGGRAAMPLGPIAAAGPVGVVEVPCPPTFQARQREVRVYRRKAIDGFDVFGDRAICEHRALATALRQDGAPMGLANAARLEAYTEWLTSIDALKGAIDEDTIRMKTRE